MTAGDAVCHFMNSPYTSLESLLVFQALRSQPVAPSTFARISEQLQAIPLIRNDPSYDASRLSPDALKDLYLRLLKDEVKRDLEQQTEKEKHATNGHLSPGSRKRKAPSPSLPTVHEAAQHAHLIPHLVARLYARYRDECIVVVREHERQYDALIRDIDHVQAGKWDQQLQQTKSDGVEIVIDNSKGRKVDKTTESVSKSPYLAPSAGQGVSAAKDGRRSPLHSNASTPGAIGSPQLQGSQPKQVSSPRPVQTPSSGPSLAPSPAPPIGSPNIRQHPLQPAPTAPGQPNARLPPGQLYQQLPQDRRPSQMTQQGQPIAPFTPQVNNAGPYPGQQVWAASGPPPQTPGMAQPQKSRPQTISFPQVTAGSGPPLPSTAPRPQQVSRMVSDIVAALATPPRQKIKPLWKSDSRRPPLSIVNLPPRPAFEPLSPTRKSAKSPQRPPRSGRGRVASPPQETEPDTRPRKGRRRATRDRSPHSVTSSTAEDLPRGKTRSQSVSTAAGAHAPSDDRPFSRGHIKDEPSTPAGIVDDHESLRERSATPASGMVTRKRQAKPRKSSLAIADDDVDMMSRTPPPRSKTVTATRNFAKMSAPIMNDINSHKHASYFAGPVRDRDASGYSDIIKRPQHLKSIRAAITAGTRAVAQAASSVEADHDGVLELDRTEDLIPPKALVNGAQLEKELMRMLANAVMFNPGEDGLVSDTREMFEDIEKTMNVWRGAEREAGGDEEEDAKGKRRKL